MFFSFFEDVRDSSSESLAENLTESSVYSFADNFDANSVDSLESDSSCIDDAEMVSSSSSSTQYGGSSFDHSNLTIDMDINAGLSDFSIDEDTYQKNVDSMDVKSSEISKPNDGQDEDKQCLETNLDKQDKQDKQDSNKQVLEFHNNFRDRINPNLGLPSSIEVEYSDFEKCVAAANLAKWMQKSSPFAIDDKELIATVIKKINSGEEGVEKWLDYRFFLKDSYAGSSHKDGVFGFDSHAAKKIDDDLNNNNNGTNNNENTSSFSDKTPEDKLDEKDFGKGSHRASAGISDESFNESFDEDFDDNENKG